MSGIRLPLNGVIIDNARYAPDDVRVVSWEIGESVLVFDIDAANERTVQPTVFRHVIEGFLLFDGRLMARVANLDGSGLTFARVSELVRPRDEEGYMVSDHWIDPPVPLITPEDPNIGKRWGSW